MTKLKFGVLKNDVEKSLNEMLNAKKHFDGWSKRVFPTLYANAMREQFMTQGSSEGNSWSQPSSAKYREWKRKNLSSFPGGGSKTMIATSRLLAASLPPDQRDGLVLGTPPPESRAKKWIELRAKYGREFMSQNLGSKVIYQTSVPYASYVNERNSFMLFSKKTTDKWAQSWLDYSAQAMKITNKGGNA